MVKGSKRHKLPNHRNPLADEMTTTNDEDDGEHGAGRGDPPSRTTTQAGQNGTLGQGPSLRAILGQVRRQRVSPAIQGSQMEPVQLRVSDGPTALDGASMFAQRPDPLPGNVTGEAYELPSAASNQQRPLQYQAEHSGNQATQSVHRDHGADPVSA